MQSQLKLSKIFNQVFQNYTNVSKKKNCPHNNKLFTLKTRVLSRSIDNTVIMNCAYLDCSITPI